MLESGEKHKLVIVVLLSVLQHVAMEGVRFDSVLELRKRKVFIV